MEFYGKDSHLKTEITKKYLQKKLQKILVEYLIKYDIKITQWHYIICLYYN